MAVQTFGVTVTLLSERYFSAKITTADPQNTASLVIAEAATEVEALLRAHRINPDEVLEAHAPMAYRWLQSTVLVGAAGEFALRTGGSGGAADAWRQDFQRKLTDLRNRPQEALVDLVQRRASTSSVYRPR
jgi:hypothetical protein